MTEQNAGTEAREALDRIKAAEAEARGMVREAREKKGPGLVQEAHEEAKKLREAKVAAAREEAAKKKAGIISAAEKEAAGIRRDTESEKAAVLEKGRKSLDKAAKAVRGKLEKIL